jgi:hypothetical protein
VIPFWVVPPPWGPEDDRNALQRWADANSWVFTVATIGSMVALILVIVASRW